MTQLERLQTRGIRRLGSPERGFRYRTVGGGKVVPKEVERIRKLAIPPAWKDVAIAPSARAPLQAVGHDARGRWQYRYAPLFVEKQQAKKYQRIQRFALALPQMRRTVQRDLSRNDLSRERVMACILRILATCFLRPGSDVYAKENGSIGIATLRPKHVWVRGDVVRFEFPGKSAQWQERELKDRAVAKVIRALLKVRGKEVFKYQDGSGSFVDVKRQHINVYIKQVMGEAFTAKDFRTWAGTLICACCLAKVELIPEQSKTAKKKAIVQAVKMTAEQLGNTPAICRSSYIYPSVLSSFDRGRVLEQSVDQLEELAQERGPGLRKCEKALLALLGVKVPRTSSRLKV